MKSFCGSVIFERTPGELDEAIDLMFHNFGVVPDDVHARLVEVKL